MDGRDPEKTLDDWKAEMQAEHERAIADPDPEADHRIEGVTQVNYRVYFDYDLERDGHAANRSRSCRTRSCSPVPVASAG